MPKESKPRERTLAGATNPTQFVKELDILVGKALQFVACTELGRRFFKTRQGGLLVVRTAKDAYRYFKDVESLPKEHLCGICIDRHYRVVHDEVISISTINTNIIHPREVFKPAMEYGAAAVVLAHNHPSGITKPSQADIDGTRQLVEVGKMLGINLINHIIIDKDSFVGFNIDYSSE
ncbi:MAG: hypothetical protein MUD00_02975 [Candidatus Pacebacteria bacterium]|nr:hypothetical protein [Candidatus Paceibacterota bacterium]